LLLLQQIRFGHLHRLSDLNSHGQGKSQHYYSKSTLLPRKRKPGSTGRHRWDGGRPLRCGSS
jgi:hypothetical protein